MAHGSDSDAAELPRWDARAILHVDMDAFFASVEQLDDPELRGKPVIVGGDPSHRGVVAAASYEARRFGVRSAMPSVRAKALCPDGVWVRPTPGRYGDVSAAVRAVLESETPLVQMVSIDEGYLDVTPGETGEHPVAIARRIQARVDEMGLSCSVGVATTKTVAKIASDRDKPHGITVVWPGTEAAFLAPLPTSLMPGLGPASVTRLARFGIRTLGDLAAMDDDTARQILGSWGPGTAARARGEGSAEVRPGRVAKSLSKERTFSTDIRDEAEVTSALRSLSEQVGERLRRKGMTGRTVHVKVRYADFTTRSAQRTLPEATDLEREFGPVAEELVMQLWNPGVGMRLLGVGLSGFEDAAEQLDLFSAAADGDDGREDALARGIDAVRAKFGTGAIRRGDTRRNSTMKTTGTWRLFAGCVSALLLTGALLTAGCASVDLTPPPPSKTATSTPAPSPASTSAPATGTSATTASPGPATGSTVPKPGFTTDSDGVSTVYGTVLHSDLEGGIYVIVDSVPGAGAGKAKAIVVIADAESFPFATMQGKYVKAKGSISDAAVSANQAGPQMVVTEVQTVTAPTP